MKNQKPNNIKIFHPLVITGLLMVVFVFGNAFGFSGVGVADDTPPVIDANTPIVPVEGPLTYVDAQTAANCQSELTQYADPEFVKYQVFMEKTFSNKSNTSSLMDLGMQRYDQFKTDIRSQMQLLIGRQLETAYESGAGATAQLGGLAGCEQAARDYISNAGKLLQMRAYTTSSIKKASLFVEKYKSINDKLRALDLEFMKMVVNISTFQEKLTCYVKTCA